jgi:hypothetical protein
MNITTANERDRAQYSQVRKMKNKWVAAIEEYLRLEEQEEREAKREEVSKKETAAERQISTKREGVAGMGRKVERQRGAERRKEVVRRAKRETEPRTVATDVITNLKEEQLGTVCYLHNNAISHMLTLYLYMFVSLP